MYVLYLKFQSRNFQKPIYFNDFPKQGKHLPSLPTPVKSGSGSSGENETPGLMSAPFRVQESGAHSRLWDVRH
jgi:hypothetical protein